MCKISHVTFLQAIILGIIQGLTEFFPVSSSAHLTLVRKFLNIEPNLYFDLVCHAGTLLALVLFLRKEIWSTLRSLKMIGLFSLALLPLVPGYFLFKSLASHPPNVGFFLIFTGLILLLASRKKENTEVPIKLKDVLCIGVMQTLALIPGISRSGSTIAAARLLGWKWLEAARFSFLLAVPAIFGGFVLETAKVINLPIAFPIHFLIAGFLSSFMVGLASVRVVFWIYNQGKVWPFACYCFLIGIFWVLHG